MGCFPVSSLLSEDLYADAEIVAKCNVLGAEEKETESKTLKMNGFEISCPTVTVNFDVLSIKKGFLPSRITLNLYRFPTLKELEKSVGFNDARGLVLEYLRNPNLIRSLYIPRPGESYTVCLKYSDDSLAVEPATGFPDHMESVVWDQEITGNH